MQQVPAALSGDIKFHIFEYLYRDASNYKAFGSVFLSGRLGPDEQFELVSCLEADEFFVAEQVGIPPLYDQLWNDEGPTDDDHGWHTLVGFRSEQISAETVNLWGDASELIAAFRAAKNKWQINVSENHAL